MLTLFILHKTVALIRDSLGAKMIKHAFKSYPKVKIGGSFAVEDPAMTEQEEWIMVLMRKHYPLLLQTFHTLQ
jgi:hypothetical protein